MFCFVKFCRLCLQRSDNLLDFKTKDLNNITFISKIKMLMPSLILTNNNAPTSICGKCRTKLINCYDFITNCYLNNETLLKYTYRFNCDCETVSETCEFSTNLDKLNNNQTNVEIKPHKNPQKLKKWHCNICNFKSALKSKLRIHLDVHNVDKYTCIICDQNFTDYSTFESHRNIHYTSKRTKTQVFRTKNSEEEQTSTPDTSNSKNPYICRVCGKSFYGEPNLRRHYESIHLKIRYNCDICNKSFSAIDSLRFHKQTVHMQLKKYECHVCNRKLSTAKNLRTHLRSRHNINKNAEMEEGPEKIYVGPEKNNEGPEKMDEGPESMYEGPESMYEGPENINEAPESMYEGPEKMYEGPEKMYERPEMYEGPEKMYEGPEKMYEAPESMYEGPEKMYEGPENINKAPETQIQVVRNSVDETTTNIPFTEEPKNRLEGPHKYKCDICAKTYSSKHNMKRHYETIHLQTRYKCNFCDKLFNDVSSLQYHKATIHLKERIFECKVCYKKFKTEVSLNQHLLSHYRKKCLVCKRNFATVELLIEHNKSEHMTPERNYDSDNSEDEDDLMMRPIEEIQIKSEICYD